MGISNIHDAEESAKSAERAYTRLVVSLTKHVNQLEQIGENDVGLLNDRLAGRYHAAVSDLRRLVDLLN